MPQVIYDLKGYPQFVYTAHDFAERKARKQPDIKQLANLLIRSIFEDGGLGRVLSIDEVTPGTPANGWTIRFTGETNGRTADPYIAIYDGEVISYNDDFSRQPRDLSEGLALALEFAAKKGQKNCNKGKPCGGSCIAKGRNCLRDKNDLSKNQQQAADRLTEVSPTESRSKLTSNTGDQPRGLKGLSGDSDLVSQSKIEKGLDEWMEASNDIKRQREDLGIQGDDRDVDAIAAGIKFGAPMEEIRAVVDSNGRLQAAASVSPRPDHLYVDMLGTAPWNVGARGGRDPSTDSRATRGAGREMMRQIVIESYKKGFNGDVRLESLNGAVGFYKKIGFKALPGEMEDNVPLMRLNSIDARKFLEATGGIPSEIQGLVD